MISLDVFTRKSGQDTFSERTFYGFISLFIGAGLFTTFTVAGYLVSTGYKMTSIWEVLLCLAVAIAGIFIVHATDYIVISLLGYAIIASSMGFPIAGQLSTSTATTIVNAGTLTLLITGIMGFLGVTFPQFFSKIGSALFFSLLALIILRIVAIFVPSLNSFGLLEYIGAGIFSLYIGYDMWRASTVTRTFKNSLDIGINLYLDILNLFSNILSILNGNDD